LTAISNNRSRATRRTSAPSTNSEKKRLQKMHLNGGIGARRKDEAFGEDYGVPNESAGIEISGDALSIRPLTRRRGY